MFFAAGALLAAAALTGFVGLYGARMTRGTSDFLMASQSVGPRWNGAAISGEYLSAASFLGVAGLVLHSGADALWYPVGLTAGYIALLLFVAAPLRRSGAYTLPDFAEARLGSGVLRRICTAFVMIICWLYLVPQLQGAGLTVATMAGWPVWIGAAVVVVIVTFNLFTGWMRSITFVQAAQYWIKITALAIPVFVLLIYLAGEPAGFRNSLTADAAPYFSTDTTVSVDTDVVVQVDAPIWLRATGEVDHLEADGLTYLAPGDHQIEEGASLHFAAGDRVPVISGAPVRNDDWLQPFNGVQYPGFVICSLLVALLLGTMGLPHLQGRYYTNPDGRAARATTLVVLALLGLFYLFPTLSGLLARLYVPELLVTGTTDAAVLLLPRRALDGWPANLLTGLVAAGAFAAFLAAAMGLVISVAGVLATDVLPSKLRNFRVGVLLSWPVPLAFALSVWSLDLLQSVALAFAVAASSFCPLLVLGIWWRGLTDVGAATGMLVGGGLAGVAVLAAAVDVLSPGWQALLGQPAVITVPLAFATMILVSRLTRDRVPTDVSHILLRMHAPDRLLPPETLRFGTATAPFPRSRSAGRHRR